MRRTLAFLIFGLLFAVLPAAAADIYVGQASAGGNTGADCADQRAYTTLVSGDYAAGNTIHICGTITGSSGSNLFTVANSGSSGNPITIKWETGAIVQAPYASAASGGVEVNGKSYITLDGGTNGIIQNTANGTSLANQQPSVLIHSDGGSNVTVKNLSGLNVYVHTLNDTNGGGSYAMLFRHVSNLTVSGNTFTQADVGLLFEWDGGESGLVITGNTWSGINQDIEMGPTTTSAGFTNVQVDHNTASNWVNWDTGTADTFHHNFFHAFTNLSGASLSGTLQIYDNTLSGNMGANATSLIFLENNNGGAGGTMGSWYIFNNIFNKTNANVPTSSGMVAVMPPTGFLFNNTFLDAGGSGANAYNSFHLYGAASGWTMTNNIFSGGAYMVYDESASVTGNNNDYYNSPSGTPWIHGGTFESTLALWRTACSCDSTAITTNPLLTGTLSLGSSSPAIGAGTNLTSLSITALDRDLAATLRPASGAWDLGAYEFTSGGGPAVSFSPTSVTFPSTTVSISSSPVTVTLTNSGTGTLTGIAISITGTNAADFSQTNTCSTSLAAAASCTISVTFTPSSTGSRTASISVADSAAGSPQTVALSGSGATAAPAPAAGGNIFMRQTTANASSTGTTINKLAKLTGAPSTLVIAGAGDTGGVVGIVVAHAGTSGNATLQLSGPVSCVFDGATTAGDYVQISSSTAGDCHDAGASYPTSKQVLGRVLSTNGSGGTYTMNLFPSEISAASPLLLETNGTNNGSQSTLNLHAGSNVTLTDNGSGQVTVAAASSGGGGGLASSAGEFILGAPDTTDYPNSVAIPGLYEGPEPEPASPTAYDDEFEGSSLGGSWSYLNQTDGAGSVTVAVAKSKAAFTMTTQSGYKNRGILETAPSATFEFTAKISWALLTSSSSYAEFGLALRESGTGKACVIGIYGNNNASIDAATWTSDTSGPGDTYFGGLGLASTIYVRVKDDGTNIIMSASPDGVIWNIIKTVAVTTVFTTAPNQVGFLGFDATNDAHIRYYSVDWIRRTI